MSGSETFDHTSDDANALMTLSEMADFEERLLEKEPLQVDALMVRQLVRAWRTENETQRYWHRRARQHEEERDEIRARHSAANWKESADAMLQKHGGVLKEHVDAE